jgi:hypothetical protein
MKVGTVPVPPLPRLRFAIVKYYLFKHYRIRWSTKRLGLNTRERSGFLKTFLRNLKIVYL